MWFINILWDFSYKRGIFFFLTPRSRIFFFRSLYIKNVRLVYCERFTIICGLSKNNRVKIPLEIATVAILDWLMRLESDCHTNARTRYKQRTKMCNDFKPCLVKQKFHYKFRIKNDWIYLSNLNLNFQKKPWLSNGD